MRMKRVGLCERFLKLFGLCYEKVTLEVDMFYRDVGVGRWCWKDWVGVEENFILIERVAFCGM